ncbi:MAG TPA: hypothetical protein VGN42_17380 [Pirellulales bacterium]|nr:hypothetical protein [Pirellulales bacterium]
MQTGAARHSFSLFDGPAAWTQWQQRLAARRASRALSQRAASLVPALSWGLGDAGEAHENTRRLIKRLAGLERRRSGPSPAIVEDLQNWLAAPSELAEPSAALDSLAWTHALPFLASSLEPALWQACLQKLLDLAEASTKSPVVGLLALLCSAGELPLALAYWFPELEVCRRLAAPGNKAALAVLDAAVDSEGVIRGEHLASLRPLLASWTRICLMEQDQLRHDRVIASEARYPKLVGQALRLARGDGSQALSEVSRSPGSKASTIALFQTALRFAGEGQRRLAELAMPAALSPEPGRRGQAKRSPRADQPSPAVNSETAQLAVLRTGWAGWEERLTVAYHSRQISAELICGRELVASGAWNPHIEFNGAPLEAESQWDEVCWFSDDDVDYLELEISLSGGVQIQRHLLLARQDHFLFAADAVLGEQSGSIAYRSGLPLAAGMRFAPSGESNEGRLIGRRGCALALPLALPEWRSEPGRGTLREQSGALELRQSATNARNLFAPLFIDLAPRRFSRPCTWRRLTVAENRQIVAPDQAAGYRVQVGGQQWLFYRSLGPRGNRTLLGHNLVTQFLAARFNRDGVAESLLEIE